MTFLCKSFIFTKKSHLTRNCPPSPRPGLARSRGSAPARGGRGAAGPKSENAKVGNFEKIQHFCDFKLKIHLLCKTTENTHFCEFLRFRGPKVLKYHGFYRQTGQGDARFALFAQKCIFTLKVDFWAQNAF